MQGIRSGWRRAALAAALTMAGFVADAQQVPQLLTVQGYLTDGGGAPVTATALTVQVTLYDDATASGDSNRLYQVIRRVDVTNGNFSALLGRPPGNISDPPIDSAVFARQSLWLGIAVGSDPEMSPRLRITAVPFAVRAGSADTLQGRAPRSCPAGSVEVGSYCIDSTARSAQRALDAMETCDNARGSLCPMGALYNACRRSRATERLAFTPVTGQWLWMQHVDYDTTAARANVSVVEYSDTSCYNRVSWDYAAPTSPAYRFYCCYLPSPTLRGE